MLFVYQTASLWRNQLHQMMLKTPGEYEKSNHTHQSTLGEEKINSIWNLDYGFSLIQSMSEYLFSTINVWIFVSWVFVKYLQGGVRLINA